tara:strand:+ start:129 stop:407 length:279 start_codon:yes stop_codon:yes gene_type:complete
VVVGERDLGAHPGREHPGDTEAGAELEARGVAPHKLRARPEPIAEQVRRGLPDLPDARPVLGMVLRRQLRAAARGHVQLERQTVLLDSPRLA